jgi:hypothetical protein
MTVYISEFGVRGGGSMWGQNPELNRSACCAAGRPAFLYEFELVFVKTSPISRLALVLCVCVCVCVCLCVSKRQLGIAQTSDGPILKANSAALRTPTHLTSTQKAIAVLSQHHLRLLCYRHIICHSHAEVCLSA